MERESARELESENKKKYRIYMSVCSALTLAISATYCVVYGLMRFEANDFEDEYSTEYDSCG